MQLHDGTFRSVLRSPSGIALAVSGGLVLIAVLAYGGWFLSSSYSDLLDPSVALPILIAVFLLAAITGFAVFALREAGKWLRWSWLFLSLGLVGAVAGVALQLYDRFFMAAVFLPGVVEIVTGIFYLLTLVGLVFFSFVFVVRRERFVLLLDLALLLFVFSLGFWYFVLASPTRAALRQDPQKLFGILAPLGSVLLLVFVLLLIQRDVTRFARLVLIALAFSMCFRIAADSLMSYTIFGGALKFQPFGNILWALAGLSEFLAAALHLLSTRHQLADSPARFNPVLYQLRVWLPYLAVALGLALHFYAVTANPSADRRLRGTLFMTIVVSAIVMLRQYLSLQENVRLYQQMRRIAITDSLTGVYNRHFFNESLPREIERAKRYSKNLCVLILDLDSFKHYNDTFGHLQADMVLKMVARLTLAQLRSSDTLARFGGDEFVVILPETNRRNAQAVAERIRTAVAGCETARVPLSVSIGAASFRPGLTPEQLLDEADQALYQQKSVKHNHQPSPHGSPVA